MTEPISRLRATYCAEVFLAAMRQELLRLHPNEECPIKTLSSYSPKHQGALVNAISKVTRAASPVSDKGFANWSERREEASHE